MRVFVTGATGLIGRRLCRRLLSTGCEVSGLSRGQARGQPGGLEPATDADGIEWHRGDPCAPGEWQRAAGRADAVFHLAGESVAGGRWTAARKRELVRSRIESTRQVVDALERAETRPSVLVCASAVGIYGRRDEELLDERSAPGSDFLAKLCVDWETEARRAEALAVRVVNVRFGIVLAAESGALATMRPLFRLGLGGPIGPGARWFPWIAADDAVGLCMLALDQPIHGPLNAVAPEVVRMRDFARTLGRVLRRPALAPAPLFALRLLLGELADHLSPGQRVHPATALNAGYTFHHPKLEEALQAELKAPS